MPSNSKNWPANGLAGIPITATTTSANTQICTTDSQAMTRDVMIDNQGTNDVFIRTGGDNTLTSTLNSFRIPAGQYRIFEKGTTNGVANTYIAYITSTGTSNIKVYIGEG